MGEFYIPKRGAGGGSPSSSSSPSPSARPSSSTSFYIPRRTPPPEPAEEEDSSSDIFSQAGDLISRGWEASRPVRDTLGNILDVTQAGMGAATAAAASSPATPIGFAAQAGKAIGSLLTGKPSEDVFDTYTNIAQENLDQIQAEKAARGEEPDLGPTDYIRAAPKVGQLALAGERPESKGGQALKRLGELGINIATDPASLSAAGVRGAGALIKAAPTLAGKAKVAIEAAFGTPLAGAIFAPDLIEGVVEGGKGAAESFREGEYLDAAGQAAEALGMGGLAALMGKGIASEVRGLRRAPEAPRPQAQDQPPVGVAPFDEEFTPPPLAPETPPLTEDALRRELALQTIDDQYLARQAAGGVEPDIFVRDFDEELAGAGEVPLGMGPLRAPTETLPGTPLAPPQPPQDLSSTLPTVPPPDVFGRVVGPETPLTVPPPPEPGRAEVPLQEEAPPATRVPPAAPPAQANDLGAALYEGGRSLGPYIAEGIDVIRRVGEKATDFLREMQPRVPEATMGQLLQLHQKIRSELGQAREEVRGRVGEAGERDPFGEILAPPSPPRLRRVSTPEEARRAYAEREPSDPLVERGSLIDRLGQREAGQTYSPERFATPEAEYEAFRQSQEFNEDAFRGPAYEELPLLRKDPGRPLTRPEIEGMIPANFRSNRGGLQGAVSGEARQIGIPQDSEAGHFQREVLSTGHLSIENAKKEASLNVPEGERKYSGYQDLGGGVEMVRRTGGYEGQDTVFFVKKNPKGETLAAAVIKNGKMTDLASYKIGSSAAARLMQGVLKSGVPFKSSDLISPDTRRLLAGAIERAQVPWSEIARWVSAGLDSIPFTEVLAKGKGVESVFAGSTRREGIRGDEPRPGLAPAPGGIRGGLREAPGRATEGASRAGGGPDAGRGGSREAGRDSRTAPKPGEGEGEGRRGGFGRPAVAMAGLDPSEGIRAVKEVAGAIKKKAPIFYSALKRAVEQKIPQSGGPSAQILKTLQNTQGVKPDEIKWTGLDEFLAARPRATRQEILDHLRENAVEVREVRLKDGGSDSADDAKEFLRRETGKDPETEWGYEDPRDYITLAREKGWGGERGERVAKFGQYTLPGGENYRELLLTLPAPTRAGLLRPDLEAESGQLAQRLADLRFERRAAAEDLAIPEANAEVRRLSKEITRLETREREITKELMAIQDQQEGKDFRSSHYDDPNILAHIRLNERIDADGKKVLFVEEIQSDWAQRGRREGFQEGGAQRATVVERPDGTFAVARDGRVPDSQTPFATRGEAAELAERMNRTGPGIEGSRVPSAPFVDSTEKWTGLAAKRVLRYAAENGFDRVAWTTGEQQAARYDLSKHVDSVVVKKSPHHDALYVVVGEKDGVDVLGSGPIPKEKIADYVGKELGDKAVRDLTAEAQNPGGNEYKGIKYAGLDLKVGGEGMKGFYDKILPGVFDKLGKKWGSKVGGTKLDLGNDLQSRREYEGPDLTIEEVRLIANDRSSVDLQGTRRDLREVIAGMREGRPFRELMAEQSDNAATALGGRLKPLPKRIEAVHSLDITPEMRRSVVEGGQALFSGLDPAMALGALRDVRRGIAGALKKEKPEAEANVEGKAAEPKPEPPKQAPAPATTKTFRDPVTGRIYSYSPRGDGGKVPEISPETATFLGRAGRDISSPPAKGKPSPKEPDVPEADINVPRISTDPAVEQFVGKMVREGGSSLFGRGPKGARGPRRGWAEVRAKAVSLGLDPSQVKLAFQKKGGFLSDVEMESASILQHEIYNRAETKFQEVGRLRKEGKGEQADVQQDLYDQEIANLASVTYAMIGARAEAARVLSLARKLGQGLTPDERNAWKLLQKTSRILGKDVPNSADFREEMFKAIKEKNSAKVGELTRKAFNKKWLDKYAEYWTSGLLSGPPTQVVNFVSNALEATVAQPSIRLIEGALDRYMNIKTKDSKRVREKYAGEALAMYKGALLAQDAALWGPKGLFSEVKDIFTLTYEDKQIARALEGDPAAMDFLEFGRAIQGKKGEAIRIPLNLLQAADQYWKTVSRGQNLHATAYRLGRQQGLKGKALSSFSGEWLKNYSGEKFPDIESSIVKAEKDATFQSQLGPFGRGLQQLATKHPMLRLMGMTFIRTPTNLLKKSLLRSPLGFLLPNWKGPEMTQAEKQRAYAEAAFGSAVMGAVWGAINAEGGVEITGSGPADFDEKETLKQSGWQENSFRHPELTGGKWVSYKRLDPISSMVGWVADLKETSDLNRWSDRWEKITASLGENIFDKSFWAGALQTMEAISNPTRHGKRWVKTQLGSHVPMTGLLGRIAQSIDPTVRQSDAFESIDVEGVPVPEAMAAKIPGLSDNLPAKRDVTGEEAQRRQEGPWGTLINPFAISEELVGQVPDLKREMVKVHGVPDQPQRYITFRDRRGKQHRVDLTDREYSLVQDEYKEAATRASRLIRSSYYESLPDEADKKEEILKIYAQARRKGRDRLYLDPDFRKREAQLRKEVATKKKTPQTSVGASS